MRSTAIKIFTLVLFAGGGLFPPLARAEAQIFFVKKVGPNCEKKGIVEGTFGKEIYEDWSIWMPAYVLPKTPAMDSILAKASQLGGNRVIINRIDGEYINAPSTTHGDYASHSNYSLVAATIHGIAYACK